VGSVQHVFHDVVIKIRQLFLQPAACLTSTLLETGVGANDCKRSRDQRLNVPSEARTVTDRATVIHSVTYTLAIFAKIYKVAVNVLKILIKLFIALIKHNINNKSHS
jgi:hypothetical protein